MQMQDFRPPGPGCWELETAHQSRPLTRFVTELIPDAMAHGFAEGTAFYGLTLSHLRSAFVNGFWYVKLVHAGMPEDAEGPLSPDIFASPSMMARLETCRRAFETRAWLEDLRKWDEEIKPDSMWRQRRLQSVDCAQLNNSALVAHISECADNVREMVRRHHVFTAGAVIPMGHFLAHARTWTGLDSPELLDLLRGASPVSRGPVRELAILAEALHQIGLGGETFKSRPGVEVMQELRAMPGAVGRAIESYLEIVGNSIVSGYDVSEPTGMEVPNILSEAIQTALEGSLRAYDDDTWRSKQKAIRAEVPAAHRDAFDTMLEDARKLARLREERSVYNDQWALGIARRAILEAGRRLAEGGYLSNPEELIDASLEEIERLLGGEDEPSSEALRERAAYRLSRTLDDAPLWLGLPPSPPPPFDAIPEAGRLGAIAMAAGMSQIYDTCKEQSGPRKLFGLGASPGVYEGPVRLIEGAGDFIRLRKGDVIVTRVTSAAFSVVIPLIGALVTDRGGRLSHPAIIARESGIPGVVGTRVATRFFRDGDVVRVDGSAGTVEKIR
jgi:phosphohistidine swiveling domain-containing protein